MTDSLFLRSYRKKEEEASDIRKQIISACYNHGGHLSSNLGTVELAESIVSSFDCLKDDVLFDVGHQSYAYKILTGRDLSLLRETNGLSPFTLRKESPYDKYDNGHSGDAISTGIGMALAKKLNHDDSYTIVIVGDASFKNGLAKEGLDVLENRVDLKNFILVINKNGMAISKENDDESLNDDFIREERVSSRLSHIDEYKDEESYLKHVKEIREESMNDHTYSGLDYLGKVEGHDYYALMEAFEAAKKDAKRQPVLFEVLTRKGYGMKEAEEDRIGFYHGVNPKFLKDDLSLEYTYHKENVLLSMMKEDKDLFVLTPAMITSSSLWRVFETYPERTLDVGIAEEAALTIASGLALKGKKPIVDIYSTFLQRAIDQVIMNISRQELSCLFLLERCSLVPGDGSSHHGLFDVALLKGIPNVRIYMAYDKYSLEYLMKNKGFEEKKAVFIRVPKEKMIKTDALKEYQDINFFKKENNDTLVLTLGQDGYEVIDSLKDENLDTALLLSLLDFDISSFLSYQNIIFYDGYGVKEGTACYLEEKLLENGYKGSFHSITMEKRYYPFGKVDDIKKQERIDKESVLKFISDHR